MKYVLLWIGMIVGVILYKWFFDSKIDLFDMGYWSAVGMAMTKIIDWN